MTEPALAFENLGFAYTPGAWILRSYSAAVQPGRIMALLGPNGRGKTTLLKLLLGALKPQEGRLTVEGRTAFVPQLFQVSFDYTVLDMVLMGRVRRVGLFAQPSRQDEAAALQALDRFGLADLAGRPFHELSGGQRQMVIFARALVAEADILVLDEPTASLDLQNQALVLDWIRRLPRDDGLTVVMTTHHPHHALAVADEVLLMTGASEYAFGLAEEMLTDERLSALYGVPMKRIMLDHEGASIETIAAVIAR